MTTPGRAARARHRILIALSVLSAVIGLTLLFSDSSAIDIDRVTTRQLAALLSLFVLPWLSLGVARIDRRSRETT